MARKPLIVTPALVGRVVRPGLSRPAPARPAPARPAPAPTPAPPRPRVTVTPEPPVLRPARPAQPVAPVAPRPASNLRKQVETAVGRIRARMAKGSAEFHAVGLELLALDRPEVLATFGAPTFGAFLEAHVMPAGTAHRYMTVAGEFSAEQVAELGVLKAFHLVQYAQVAKARFRASVLATRDAKIGSPARRISTLTADEVAGAVRMQKMTAGRAKVPQATSKERRAAKQFVAQIEERFGVDATMRIDKKRGVLRLEVKLSDLLEG